MRTFELIGLSGKSGTGKDHIAEHILKPLGYHQFSFAWHPKVFMVAQKTVTFDEIFHEKPEWVRGLMQKSFTEGGRDLYGEDIWADTMFTWFEVFAEYWGVTKFMIPDVRFPNEVESIQRAGGKVIRIDAPIRASQNKLTPEQRKHSGEIALDAYHGFDGIVLNDDPEIPIEEQVSALLKLFMQEQSTARS
jgi:hypothetical protein